MNCPLCGQYDDADRDADAVTHDECTSKNEVIEHEIRAYGQGFRHGLALMFVCCLIGWAAFPIIFVLLLLEK